MEKEKEEQKRRQQGEKVEKDTCGTQEVCPETKEEYEQRLRKNLIEEKKAKVEITQNLQKGNRTGTGA